MAGRALTAEELLMWGLIDSEIFEEILDLHYVIKTGLLTLDELYDVKPLSKGPAGLAAIGGASPSAASATAAAVAAAAAAATAAAARNSNGPTGLVGGSKPPQPPLAAQVHKSLTAKPAKVKPPNANGGANGSGKPHKNLHPMVVQCPICLESVAGTRFAPHLEKCMNGGKRQSLATRKYDGLYGDDWHTSKATKPVFTDPYPNSAIVRVKLKSGLPRPNQLREGVSVEEFVSIQSSGGS